MWLTLFVCLGPENNSGDVTEAQASGRNHHCLAGRDLPDGALQRTQALRTGINSHAQHDSFSDLISLLTSINCGMPGKSEARQSADDEQDQKSERREQGEILRHTQEDCRAAPHGGPEARHNQ